MKLIYLIAGTYRPAGMERVLAGKTRWLSEHGYEILVVTTDQRGREPAFTFDASVRHLDLGIDYEETNGAPFPVKLIKYPFKQIRHYFALKRVLMAEKADVVVSMFCNDANLLPGIKDGSRKVLEIHFSRFKRIQYGRRGLWALADKWRSRTDLRTVGKYDRFVVLTEEDRGYWGESDNIRVIPNSRTFAPSGTHLPPIRPKVVLAAGRYNAQKAFDRLVKAWAGLPASLREDGWRLVIAGDGEERQALESLVAALGLGDSVSLVHNTSDVRSLYDGASIYAMTSLYEGLPMVLLEAQASGLPVVAMSCKCGPRDVVTDGVDGLLVPDGDVEAFTSSLRRLMEDESLRSSMGASALVSSERFDEDSVMHKWDDLFREIASTDKRLHVVVSAVNLRKGGTLTILRQCLSELGAFACSGEPGASDSGSFTGLLPAPVSGADIKVTALVHKKALCEFSGVEYIEMPWCIRSWGHRLWAEYITMHRISRRMEEADGRKVWLWLSLHDTTPRVVAEHRQVYCHTSFPFLKLKAHDWLMDPKIPLFALFTKWAYRINVRCNDSIIVQQNWFADALSGLTGVPRSRFRVMPPASALSVPVSGPAPAEDDHITTFLFAATPDCHKDFETLCAAAAVLENEGRRFKVTLTIKGDENRYAGWLYGRWGKLKSVDFHGFMTKDELMASYAGADCFVCPSRVETWCLPISEYMAVHPGGRMLLADLPYAHETSGGKASFFPSGDVCALAGMMAEIIDYEDSSNR